MALALIPSSSIKAEMLSIPVSKRRLLTSGDNLGTVLPRTKRITARISMEIPRAVSQVRRKMK
jgi:hypothetical protein